MTVARSIRLAVLRRGLRRAVGRGAGRRIRRRLDVGAVFGGRCILRHGRRALRRSRIGESACRIALRAGGLIAGLIDGRGHGRMRGAIGGGRAIAVSHAGRRRRRVGLAGRRCGRLGGFTGLLSLSLRIERIRIGHAPSLVAADTFRQLSHMPHGRTRIRTQNADRRITESHPPGGGTDRSIMCGTGRRHDAGGGGGWAARRPA